MPVETQTIKIEDKRRNNRVELRTLTIGHPFLYYENGEERLYIRTDLATERQCLEVATGYMTEIEPTATVEPVSIEITVNDLSE